MANLYTKTGDDGTTGLIGGNRVSKSSLRVNCYGTIDEANSMLGMAYAFSDCDFVKNKIQEIQKKLFSLGAELASDEKGLAVIGGGLITCLDAEDLEDLIDLCTETTGRQTSFVIPGVNKASSSLHVARTIIRRAERNIVRTREKGEQIRDDVLRYVNRLSDAVYALARYEETMAQKTALKETVIRLVNEKLSENGFQSSDQDEPFSLRRAGLMAIAAERKAKEMNVPIVFSAVDAGGNLILKHRMPGALQGSLDVSEGKAYTANAFHMPTDVLSDKSAPGGELYGIQNSNRGKIVVFGGGYPVMRGNIVEGGIGVSGGTVEEDMTIAQYALSAC